MATLTSSAFADDLDDAQDAFQRGNYQSAVASAERGVDASPPREALYRIEAESLLTLGRYEVARSRLERALTRFPTSLRLRLLSREADLFTNNPDAADNGDNSARPPSGLKAFAW